MNFEVINKSYPYSGDYKASVKTIAFISWFIFFFVFFFRSEQYTQNASYTYRLLISFYFGMATFVVAIINTIIFNKTINVKIEQNWRVWNEILLYVIQFATISITIFFLRLYIAEINIPFSFIAFLKSVGITVLVGAIPVSLHIINEQKKLFKQNFELATQLNPEVKHRAVDSNKSTLTFNNKPIAISDILFAESNKNYVDLSLINEDSISVRITIKEMENKLADYPQFIRCHRAYIVNTNMINAVEGNAQGLRLFLNGISSYIPVSRSYIPKVDHVIRPNK